MSENITFFVADNENVEPESSKISIISADEDLVIVSTNLPEVPEYSEEMRSKIEIIKRNTNYTEDHFIAEKLKQHNGNEINVIREYMGISLQKPKPVPFKSLNQEIYRQLREHTRITKTPFAHMR